MGTNEITTWAAKIPVELKEKITTIIREEDVSSKEFLNNVVNLYELEKLKGGSGMEKDIEEFQINLERIFEIFKSVIDRNNNLGKSIEEKFNRIAIAKDEEITKLNEENLKLKEKIDKLKEEQKEVDKKIQEDKSIFEEANTKLKTNEELVDSLKREISHLENSKVSLEKEIEGIPTLLESKNALQKEKEELLARYSSLEKEMLKVEAASSTSVELVTLQKEKEKMALETAYTEKLNEANRQLMAKEQELNNIQKSFYEEKIALLQEISSLKEKLKVEKS